MAEWGFTKTIRPKGQGFKVGAAHVNLGDAFSPSIPTDKLSSLNWTVKGTVKLYAADMTFIAEYGPGERMMVTDPAHLAMGKAVLIASSEAVEYYCMRPTGDKYLDGEIITLAANESHTFSGVRGSKLFVGEGALVTPKAYPKGAVLILETIDELAVTAGPGGAIITLFWEMP
jgi:hypothetical protein